MTVSLAAFNCLPNGSNMVTALQAAIDSGSPLYAPPGEYIIDGTITLRSLLSLVGDGRGSVSFKRAPGASGHLFQGTNLSKITLSRVAFNGNRTNCPNAQNTFELTNVTFSSLTECGFSNAKLIAVRWFGCSHNLILGNEISGSGTIGLRMGQTGDNYNTRVIANHVYNNGQEPAAGYGIGISLDACRRFIVTGNNSHNNDDNNIDLWNCQDSTVTGNTCIASAHADGIALDGGTGSGNTDSDLVVTGNICRFNRYGINMANKVEYSIVSGNNLRGNTTAGMQTPSISTRSVFTGNVV